MLLLHNSSDFTHSIVFAVDIRISWWPIIGVLLITEQRPVLQHQLWDANSICFCSPMCMSLKGKSVFVMSKTLL